MTTKKAKRAKNGAKTDEAQAPEVAPQESPAPAAAGPEPSPVHAEVAGPTMEAAGEPPALTIVSQDFEERPVETSARMTMELPIEAPVTASEPMPESGPTVPGSQQAWPVDDDDDPDDEETTEGRDCDLREKVEALLFSAPKPLRSAEIAEFCSVSKDEARAALRSLRTDYRKRRTGLEIVKIDGRYQMRVRRGAEEAARLVAPTDISRDLLKTVTVIAFYQPMLQSELVEMVGSKAYDQVRELEERKLIRSAPYAQTKALATGLTFAEYFGLRTGKPEEVRKWVAKRLGREPPAPRTKLTPALAAAEGALDPSFIEGRMVEARDEPAPADPARAVIAPPLGEPSVGETVSTGAAGQVRATAPAAGADAGPAVTTAIPPDEKGSQEAQAQEQSSSAEG